ncbi:hypothetical protein [Fusibacter bizertensis]
MDMFLELKSQLKRYSIAFFIVIMILVMSFMVASYERQATFDKVNSRMVAQILNDAVQTRVRKIDLPQITGEMTEINSYEEAVYYQSQLSNELLAIDKSSAFQSYNLNRVRFYLIGWFSATSLNDEWRLKPESQRLLDPEAYFGSEWEHVRQHIHFPAIGEFSYKDLGLSHGDNDAFPQNALYFLDLYEKEIEGGTQHSVSPFIFIYLLFQSKLPMVLAAFSVIMGASVIGWQRENGVIKNKLFKGRHLFIIRSTIIGCLTSLVVILIIFTSVWSYLGFQHGFSDANQLVLVKKTFVTEWAPDLEIVSLGEQIEKQYSVGIVNQIVEKNPKETFEKNIFMPLWKVIFIQLTILILTLIFWNVVGVLISSLVKNNVLAIGLSGGVFFFSALITFVFPNLAGTMWDLMGYFEINQIMSGFKPVTLMQIVTVNCIGIVLMHVLSVWRFSSQDVV